MKAITRGCCCIIAMVCGFPIPASGQATLVMEAVATGSCVDKVRITAFAITPPKPAPGSTALLSLTIANLCSGTTASSVIVVPWLLRIGNATLRSGIAVIPPTSTAVANTRWTATAGTFSFEAEVDPANTLGEPAAARANNLTDAVSVTIRAPNKGRPNNANPASHNISEEKK